MSAPYTRPVTITTSRNQNEHRFHEVAAVLANSAVTLFILEKVQLLPTWVMPLLGVPLLTPLIAFSPRRLTRETTWSKWLSISSAILLTLANRTSSSLVTARLSPPSR